MKIAVASGKGGTGKTTLSVNLAAFLAETMPVVLTDLDVEEPNSGLFLSGNLQHHEEVFRMVPSWDQATCTLCGLCQEVCNFHSIIKMGDQIIVFPELCHGCYACSELCPAGSLPMVQQKMGELNYYNTESFPFVESRLDIGQEQAVPLIAHTLSFVDITFPGDIIKIYDSPPGTSCPVIKAAKDADLVILVTEPTPFGLHDLQLAVDTVKDLKKEFGVVINRYGLGDAGVEEYCRQEKIEIIARLPNKRRIAELYSQGKMVYRDSAGMKKGLEEVSAFIRRFERGASL